MYEDLRNAVKLLKEYCINHECVGCPLNHVSCYASCVTPAGYSLDKFDKNVKELEEDD